MLRTSLRKLWTRARQCDDQADTVSLVERSPRSVADLTVARLVTLGSKKVAGKSNRGSGMQGVSEAFVLRGLHVCCTRMHYSHIQSTHS